MTKRLIHRMDAVRDQINTAIRAYFLWDDLISAVTLAGAAERVLSDKQKQDGLLGVDAFSVRSAINLYINKRYQKETAQLVRSDYDFFRHADRCPNDEYEFSEERADFTLIFAIGAFEFLGQKKTKDMKAFVHWLFYKHPCWLKKSDSYEQIATQLKRTLEGITKQEYYRIFLEVGHGP